MTLIEVLVASTLALLLLTLAYKFLVPALRISSQTTLRAESQQGATLALRSMVSDLEQSSLFGINFVPGVGKLAVHPVRSVTEDGARIYSESVTVYSFNQGSATLDKIEWKSSDSPSISKPHKLSEYNLLNLSENIQSQRTLVTNVDDFSVTHAGDEEFVELPISLRIRIRATEGSSRGAFELLRTVSPRHQS